MDCEFLIIGQGISGTFLSYYLQKEKRGFIVLDNNDAGSPSRIAAGLINPVTGRRMVTVWMADEVLPFAWKAYHEMGTDLGITAISQKNIIDFFPNPFMRENFLKRLAEGSDHIKEVDDPGQYTNYFKYEFGCGQIDPVYVAHLEVLLPSWRSKLKADDLLWEEQLELNRLVVEDDSIRYETSGGKLIRAKKIIFCDGAAGVVNTYFKQLPFAPNKGEALILEIPNLPSYNVYKKSLTLVPLQAPGMFWIGSNYLWEFDNVDPTVAFRESTESVLREWLKIPFKTVDHWAGLRPATLERRPFVGFHPNYPAIGILNGMGTKGCSLAPFFANQLTGHLVHGRSIAPGADVNRFRKILIR